jgi:hypothetical protein
VHDSAPKLLQPGLISSRIKCLRWLREAHDAIPCGARAAVDKALAGSGCDALFAT